jgi:hypothetical protein
LQAKRSDDPFKVIMGRINIMRLGLFLEFKNGKLLWDELELNLECTVTQSEELNEDSSRALSTFQSRMMKIVDGNDLDDAVPIHSDAYQGNVLYHLLTKYEALFEGKLGTMPGCPLHHPNLLES